MTTQGSIRQDKTGRWYFVVDTPSPDERRRQLRRRGFKTKKKAQAALTTVLGDVQRGTFVMPVRTTVRGYLEHWLATLPGQGRRFSTVDSYGKLLARHVYPTLGAIELQQLRALDLDGLYGLFGGAGHERPNPLEAHPSGSPTPSSARRSPTPNARDSCNATSPGSFPPRPLRPRGHPR